MITKYPFGSIDGQTVYNYTLSNQNGMSVTISEFGGTVVKLCVPDREGRISDVACGYDALDDYRTASGYVGALVGRTANRIANGTFTLDGKTYHLCQNNGVNSLHGGKIGYSFRVWDSKAEDGEEPKLILSLFSPDGEENYPGNLTVKAVYTLCADNALKLVMEATTDQRTPVGFTNHTYFNLGGYASGSIADHVLQIDADTYLPTDETQIPTGVFHPVEGTPFDFRKPKPIGQDLWAENEDLRIAGGYDHNFNFIGGASKQPIARATVWEPKSGRLMTVLTDQPAIQLYTGNYLEDDDHRFKGGYPRIKQTAFCLETQAMPDSINQKGFNDIVLNPGEVYTHTVIYQFSVK